MFGALQNWMIFPGACTQGRREARVQPQPDAELLQLRTGQGEQVAALFGKALTPDGQRHPGSAARPTVIWFYGNGMCLADSSWEFAHLRRMGMNVLVPEFVGYGMSSGRPSERGHYDTAETAYEHLLRRCDIDGRKIIPMGWSLGAAAAIELAYRHPGPGVGLFSTFTSMAEMAKLHVPWAPVSALAHRFENARKVAELKCPVFIAHGRKDGVVPCWMGEKLAQAARGCAVTTAIVEEAGHNDLFQVAGMELEAKVRAFLEQSAG